MTKAQPASTGLGRSYFKCLTAGAYACILKLCGLNYHRCSIAVKTSIATSGISIGPGSSSGPMTACALLALAGLLLVGLGTTSGLTSPGLLVV